MYAPHTYSEHLKLVRAFDAIDLDRKGYWGCIVCTAHNDSLQPICSVCGARCWITDMPTELLSLGPLLALVQNRIYALPTVKCMLFCEVPAATFEQSATVSFTASAPVTLSAAGMAEVSGGFIRCTSGNVNVTLKRA